MKEITIAVLETIGKIGVAYIVAACLVGADALIPHKYIYINKQE